ncbi:MAG TPA: ribonuclease P protein component [Tepidisphaeraceae bacterium]|nr:ribonuclease P protein component [Tepidisphaeraceae bacterium]
MSPRATFPRTHRLKSPAQFSAVYSARVRESRGPVTLYMLPNDLGHPRLGLSVSRKVGTAPRRNRIKRLLRECFRSMQHDLPRGYDWVVVVRPHEPLALDEYQKLLSSASLKLHNAWQRREEPLPASPLHPKLAAD